MTKFALHDLHYFPLSMYIMVFKEIYDIYKQHAASGIKWKKKSKLLIMQLVLKHLSCCDKAMQTQIKKYNTAMCCFYLIKILLLRLNVYIKFRSYKQCRQ